MIHMTISRTDLVSQLSSRGTEERLQAEEESSHTLASVSTYLEWKVKIIGGS